MNRWVISIFAANDANALVSWGISIDCRREHDTFAGDDALKGSL